MQQADRERGFDFAHPPLMRLTLIRVEEDEHWLIWSHHHALLDGWSMPILVNGLLSCYGALSQGRLPQLGPMRRYRDYIEWLRRQA